jgi:hypothetical protein
VSGDGGDDDDDDDDDVVANAHPDTDMLVYIAYPMLILML